MVRFFTPETAPHRTAFTPTSHVGRTAANVWVNLIKKLNIRLEHETN